MLKEQETQYIDTNIEKVFHFLELKGHHTFLIGSNSIRNILYANDYDLNSNVGVSDSLTVLHKIYEEFLSIFKKAYMSPEYYILMFQCGYYEGERICWSYKDMQRGSVKRGMQVITFEECLLMDDDNIIMLNLCYLYHDVFTDINCLYHLYIVKNKAELDKRKAEEQKNVGASLREEIAELEHDKEYFKALKRYFTLGIVEGKVDEDILDMLNSDLGIMFKCINFLQLVMQMIEQDFKPIGIEVIRDNLEYIKAYFSHVTSIKVESYLNRLIKVIKMDSIKKMKVALEKLVTDASKALNTEISS